MIVLLLAFGATGSALAAGAGQSHKASLLVTATRVGPLTIGKARASDVRAHYGTPAAFSTARVGYDCSAGPGTPCKTNFLFDPKGPFAGRLMAFIVFTAKRGFRTAGGSFIGKAASAVRADDPPMASRRQCGEQVLRYSRSAGIAGDFAGLSLVVQHQKIAEIVVVSPHERVTCNANGSGFGFG
jgi:hypothetical protein